MIPFGEWAPDLPDYVDVALQEAPHAVVAQNCIPYNGYYLPLSSIQEVSSSSLDNVCQGAASLEASDSTVYTIAGDAAKLYMLQSDNTFANVSKVGGYITPIDGNWNFTQYSNQILATNFADTIQTYTMGSSSVFADLGGSPPTAKYITNILNYVVCAFTGGSPYTVQWSDQNAPTNWATGDARTVGLEAKSGPIKAICGGEYGVIFRDQSIHRMNFVGPPAIFSFQQVQTNRGLYANNAYAQFGEKIFYLAQDGFYIFDGNQSIPIGEQKVNKFFFSLLNTAFAYRIQSVVDIRNTLIITIFPDGSASNGIPNRALIYNYTENKWSYIFDIQAQYIFPSRSVGYTIDSVDSLFPTIDSVPYTFDSDFWTGGNLLISVFTPLNRLGSFIGTPLTATFETCETAPSGAMVRTSIPWIQPIVLGQSNITVSMGVRDSFGAAVTYTAPTMLNASQLVPISVNNRYIRARVVVTGGFDRANGVEILGAQRGAMI